MDLVKLRGTASMMLFKHKLSQVGWTFGFADTGRRLGVCKYKLKLIQISRHYAENSPEENVMDTLLHEIAHALVGPGHGHGPVWKAMAIKLGATPKACDDSDDTEQKPGDWQATCPSCGKTYHKYKTPRQLTGYRCKCRARSPLVFEWKGEPALKPVGVPMVAQPGLKDGYFAKCQRCGVMHHKTRKPTRPLVCKCVGARRATPEDYLQWRLITAAQQRQAAAQARTPTPPPPARPGRD